MMVYVTFALIIAIALLIDIVTERKRPPKRPMRARHVMREARGVWLDGDEGIPGR